MTARRARLGLLLVGTACAHRLPNQAVSFDAAGPDNRGRVLADAFFSNALGAAKHLMVYLPASYDHEPNRRYPVAYYLHGLSGAEADWIAKGNIDGTADSLVARGAPETIIVMPDGDDGWYTTWNTQLSFRTCADTLHVEAPDTYCVEHERYDDYVAHDVVAFIDGHYRTLADRAHRGIGGLSMGGYGAVILALKHPDVFAAAASHSGVLSTMYVGPHPFVAPPRYAATVPEIRPAAGSFWPRYLNYWGTDIGRWRDVDAARAAEELVRSGRARPALFIDCGVDDGFVDQNRAFHFELTRIGYAHSYAEWPGAHTWRYWSTHVAESLAWMTKQIAP